MKWFIALFCVLAAAAASAQETRIVAVVNSDIITDADLAARIRLVEVSSNTPDTPENRQHLEPQILRTLVDEKLEMQDAKKLGITVDDADVDKAVQSIEQRNGMPKGSLEDYLKQHGISHTSLIDQITASLAFAKVVEARVSQDVQVSDDEIDEAMKRLRDDIGKPESRVAEIFLAVDNPSQDAEVKQLADRLIDQIRGGANFSGVAQQFSQSPSAAVGGDIGWITPEELSPRLAEAVEKMSPGQMSFPVRTPAGYYILYLLERRVLGSNDPGKITLSLTEVVFPLAQDATPDQRNTVTAEAQQVTTTAKSCADMARLGKERAPQLSRQVPQARAADLAPEIRAQILALKVSEASKPMPLAGGIGVVMVCNRQDPPDLPSRDQLSDTLARERLDALAQRYLRDLRRGAYIDLRS